MVVDADGETEGHDRDGEDEGSAVLVTLDDRAGAVGAEGDCVLAAVVHQVLAVARRPWIVHRIIGISEWISHFGYFYSLAGCIFTKLDECLSLGEIINVAIQNALPVSYLTNGQRVPEDIDIAEATAMVAQAEQLRMAHNSSGHQWYQDGLTRTEETYA